MRSGNGWQIVARPPLTLSPPQLAKSTRKEAPHTKSRHDRTFVLIYFNKSDGDEDNFAPLSCLSPSPPVFVPLRFAFRLFTSTSPLEINFNCVRDENRSHLKLSHQALSSIHQASSGFLLLLLLLLLLLWLPN